jgi:UrcA family protein
MSALAIASALGSGIAFGDEADTTEPASDIDMHIYSFGDSLDIERNSVTVTYADLNINNEKGAAVLYRRLQVASESVCGIRFPRAQKDLQFKKIAEDCYDDALSRAVDAIGSELLLSLHQGTEPPEVYAATPE